MTPKSRNRPEPPKQTFINWISVHDQLPKTDRAVLVLNESNDIYEGYFDPETGWDLNVSTSVKFWSEYNLPK